MRPVDPEGSAGLGHVERLWAGTVERARTLRRDRSTSASTASGRSSRRCATSASPPTAGSAAASLGDPDPWDPLDLPWDEMPDRDGVPRDRERPALEEVLPCAPPQATVRRVIEGLTAERLEETLTGRDAGRPPTAAVPVAQCLLRRAQRGVGAPPVRRARPDRSGITKRTDQGDLTPWTSS